MVGENCKHGGNPELESPGSRNLVASNSSLSKIVVIDQGDAVTGCVT